MSNGDDCVQQLTTFDEVDSLNNNPNLSETLNDDSTSDTILEKPVCFAVINSKTTPVRGMDNELNGGDNGSMYETLRDNSLNNLSENSRCDEKNNIHHLRSENQRLRRDLKKIKTSIDELHRILSFDEITSAEINSQCSSLSDNNLLIDEKLKIEQDVKLKNFSTFLETLLHGQSIENWKDILRGKPKNGLIALGHDIRDEVDEKKLLESISREMADNISTPIRNFIHHICRDFIDIKHAIKLIDEQQREINQQRELEKKKSNFWQSSFEQLEIKYKRALEENRLLNKKLCKLKSSISETMRVFLKLDLNEAQFDCELINNTIVTMVEKNNRLQIELDTLKKWRKAEEDGAYILIQAMSEAEMQLELCGRRPNNVKSVISNFIKNSCNLRGSSLFASTVTKMLLQSYSNQLKWVQAYDDLLRENRTPAAEMLKSTSQTDINEITTADSDSEAERQGERGADNAQAEVNDDDDDNSEASGNDLSWSDDSNSVDVDKINYILMNNRYDDVTSARRDLDVVIETEEVTTEAVEESEADGDQQESLIDDVDPEVVKLVSEMIDYTEKLIERENSTLEKTPDKTTMVVSESAPMISSDLKMIRQKIVEEEPCVKINLGDAKLENSSHSFLINGFINNLDEFESYNEEHAKIVEIQKEINKSEPNLDHLRVQIDNLETELAAQKLQLANADDKIAALEVTISTREKSDTFKNDEIQAWKEMVEHQREVMRRVTEQLEEKDVELSCLRLFKMHFGQKTVTERSSQTERSNCYCLDLKAEQSNAGRKEDKVNDLSRNEGPRNNCDNEARFSAISSISQESDDFLTYETMSDNLNSSITPKNTDEKLIRRHSCQERTVTNNVYSKRKSLKMKSVEIVYLPEKLKNAFPIFRNVNKENGVLPMLIL